MSITRISTADNRVYTSAISAEGKSVFVSGQIPLRDGMIMGGSIGDQTTAVLENISEIPRSAGATRGDVSRRGVLLPNLQPPAAGQSHER